MNMGHKGFLILAALLGGASGALADAPAATSEPLPATWTSHSYEFQYMGFTSTYSCDGLRDRVQLLLRAMAATDKAVVTTSDCDRPFGQPTKFARVKITFSSLQPADATATSTADTGNPPVNGVWRNVTFGPNQPYDLEGGDCELIEQFRDKILPLFATRNVRNGVHCVPFDDAGNLYSLHFEVFAPEHPSKK